MQLSLDNPLWKFSLAVYPEPGVSDELIALQDEQGLYVNLLLFGAYMGGIRGVTLSRQDIDEATAAIAGWQRDVLRPLRAARRALKPIEADAAQALRNNVKGDELTAEQIEQAMLWACCERLSGRPAGDRAAALEANIAAVAGQRAPKLARAVLRQGAEI